MDEFINIVQGIMQYAQANIDTLDYETQGQIAQFLNEAFSFIEQERGRQVPTPPPLPLGADILWQIANGNPDAFVSYLRTVPDVDLRVIAQNPDLLRQTVERLSREFPPEERPVIEGIEQAPLTSSNIFGFHYDPQSGDLLVRFQGGSIYAYSGVPRHIFNIFAKGAIPAKTEGQNAYGKWWVGKIPSLGAAFYELIRNGGYPYEQVA